MINKIIENLKKIAAQFGNISNRELKRDLYKISLERDPIPEEERFAILEKYKHRGSTFQLLDIDRKLRENAQINNNEEMMNKKNN